MPRRGTSFDTNKHSLRSLWSENDDFWDVQMQHDCAGTPGVGRCTFSTNLTELATADGVLFSAQLFPGLGRFEEVLARISPHTHTILWNTEAVDTFQLGPQLPVLETKLDWSASYEMHSDVPLLQVPSLAAPLRVESASSSSYCGGKIKVQATC